jgi:hypothetical protein
MSAPTSVGYAVWNVMMFCKYHCEKYDQQLIKKKPNEILTENVALDCTALTLTILQNTWHWSLRK